MKNLLICFAVLLNFTLIGSNLITDLANTEDFSKENSLNVLNGGLILEVSDYNNYFEKAISNIDDQCNPCTCSSCGVYSFTCWCGTSYSAQWCENCYHGDFAAFVMGICIQSCGGGNQQ